MNRPNLPTIDLLTELAPHVFFIKMKVGEIPVLLELARNLASFVNPCVVLSRTKSMSLKLASVMVALMANVPAGWLTLDIKVLPAMTEIGLC